MAKMKWPFFGGGGGAFSSRLVFIELCWCKVGLKGHLFFGDANREFKILFHILTVSKVYYKEMLYCIY